MEKLDDGVETVPLSIYPLEEVTLNR